MAGTAQIVGEDSEGNLVPIKVTSGALHTSDLGNLIATELDQHTHLLNEILDEFKIMNNHLSLITENNFTSTDDM